MDRAVGRRKALIMSQNMQAMRTAVVLRPAAEYDRKGHHTINQLKIAATDICSRKSTKSIWYVLRAA